MAGPIGDQERGRASTAVILNTHPGYSLKIFETCSK